MKNLHETSLRESWQIQKRVIGALLMREIITRYGRRNIGFLWLFVEPLLMTLFMVMMWKFMRADKFSSLNMVAFVATGYPLAMMWRNASNRAIGAIAGNIGLLYHRNVRVLDTIFARMILEIGGATIAQIVIMTLLIVIGWIDLPADPMYMIFAWLLMAMFAVGFGLIICSVAFHFEVFGKIWSVLSFVLFPISGVFFFVNSLPAPVQELALRIPMIHGTEMFRHGYFGSSVITLEQPWFLFLCNLALLLLGLLMVRAFSDGVEPE
ncbi:ABC transporter permease [Alysiella filiformis]|uniref:Transport permease protein n=1 Tax=Alysiella filiformis DSM 16848 TaxID=1120981 RepID=A0A286E2F8_9NEIS|nr:ABC transporter permease [Alysiella filiformis]QMT30891.1 ABC transporter permease [Alysiella filiformis]UBQ56124.1 ABC transporter permease [Alysiella filiformis DSM 16848]SOD65072.1 capsular polysaccharide transport system permease protein [Alysiella filiformis DSM 16848]